MAFAKEPCKRDLYSAKETYIFIIAFAAYWHSLSRYAEGKTERECV